MRWLALHSLSQDAEQAAAPGRAIGAGIPRHCPRWHPSCNRTDRRRL